MTKISAKRWFIILIAIILLTDIVILVSVPILRPVLGFLCFTIIPGLLLLHIFKLSTTSFLNKFLLTVGLSLSFLIFSGSLVNGLLLLIGYTKPLSTTSLVISFSIILAILSIVAYWRNRHGFYHVPTPALQNYDKSRLFSPLLLAFLLPLISVLGTYVMNATGNNVLLIVALCLILAYIVLMVCLNGKVLKMTYPVAIWMISIALLLMWGLTSNYLLGMATVYREYEAFQVVSNNAYWSMSNYRSLLTACLSTSLLPATYQSLLGIDGLYIYKVIYQIIFSLVPLACYALFSRYLSPLYAFLASFFVIAQLPFLFIMPQFMRGEVALLFFALAMMVFLDDKIDELNRKALFLIFIASLVVSYYAMPVVLLALLLPLWLFSKAMRGSLKSKSSLSGGIIALLLVLIFTWWSQLTETAFTNYVLFGRETIVNLGNLFVTELREPTVQAVYGAQLGSLPQTITTIVYNITFVFIAIGVVTSIIRRDKRFSTDYLVLILASFMLLVAWVVLPFVSTAFGAEKMYMISLVLLAPMFVIGGEIISKYIFRLRSNLVPITSILLFQFFCASFLIYMVLNVAVSPVLNSTGHGRDLYYVHDQEVTAAKWLYEHNPENLTINTDGQGIQIFILAGHVDPGRLKINTHFFIDNRPVDNSYIFLRRINIAPGIVYKAGFFDEPVEIAECSHLFTGKNKIYSNASAEVHK